MSADEQPAKPLSVPALLGIVVVYLALIQGVGLLLTAGEDFSYGEFSTTEAILRASTIPVALSVVFAAVVVAWLGWWDLVLHEARRLGRWAWVFPGLMLLSITLLATVLLVGTGEELMFRGVTPQSMRGAHGTTICGPRCGPR